ncbi:MAG: DUF4331 domain-containing protein [Cyanobacteria bacterium]|nr:DUF4331 domain-containing protein [Cyanobacteriota bacterium]MDA1020224.1 DUF4331 domain-containing protein [Cyanobacteriota bacterium]
MNKLFSVVLALLIMIGTNLSVMASSHREAPQITHSPKIDGTDLYLFRSYETGRDGFITIIANYDPLQDAYGGPNYFTLDENALYDIKIDNDGDAVEDITFRFEFTNELTNQGKGQVLTIDDKEVSIALANIGSFSSTDESNRSRLSTYTIGQIKDRAAYKYGTTSNKPRKTKAITGTNSITEFSIPEDNIGNKSVSDYATYAASFIHDITIPGCDTAGRVFVGQRKEGFQVNLGEVFDLVNLNPLGAEDGEASDTADKNITSIALEIPTSCLTESDEQPIIGAWTTASLPARQILKNKPSFLKNIIGSTTDYVQASRLGAPLVNELVIGLPDKDLFNSSQPKDDGQFATYVTNPTIPAILEALFGVTAPTLFPRTDLISIFLTGVTGLNEVDGVTASEMLRLNTSTAITASGSQNKLGVIAGDNAGYPNGRRPGDDVVDITLRAAMGVLLDIADAPSKDLAYTDGALNDETQFDTSFPYLLDPLPGSPN